MLQSNCADHTFRKVFSLFTDEFYCTQIRLWPLSVQLNTQVELSQWQHKSPKGSTETHWVHSQHHSIAFTKVSPTSNGSCNCLSMPHIKNKSTVKCTNIAWDKGSQQKITNKILVCWTTSKTSEDSSQQYVYLVCDWLPPKSCGCGFERPPSPEQSESAVSGDAGNDAAADSTNKWLTVQAPPPWSLPPPGKPDGSKKKQPVSLTSTNWVLLFILNR